MLTATPVNLYREKSEFRRRYIPFVQGECGSAGIEFHLFQSPSEPVDLTGKTVTCYFIKPDGKKIFLPADISAATAAQGVAAVTLTAQSTAASGLTKSGEVRVTGEDGGVLKFQMPDLYFAPSDTEGAVESTSEFHALDVALDATNKNLKDAQDALKSAGEATSNSQKAADASNAAATGANTAAEGATRASAAAADAASSANSAAKSASDDAAAASTAAQRANLAAASCETVAADISSAVAAGIAAQKGAANGLASLDGRQKLAQMPTADDVGAINPNLLINGDFRVNQRGQESYSSSGYTFDRWRNDMDPAATGITVTRGLIGASNNIGRYFARLTVTSVTTSGGNNFVQPLEDSANGTSPLGGQTVTFSAVCNTQCTYRCLFIGYLPAGSNSYQYVTSPVSPTSGTPKRFSVTITLPQGAKKVSCGMGITRAIQSSDINTFIDFYDCKLETGAVPTVFCPKPFAEELSLCKRYYQQGSSAVGIAVNQYTMAVFANFETEMAVVPKISGIHVYDMGVGDLTSSAGQITLDGISTKQVAWFTVASAVLTAGKAYQVEFSAKDAEIW